MRAGVSRTVLSPSLRSGGFPLVASPPSTFSPVSPLRRGSPRLCQLITAVATPRECRLPVRRRLSGRLLIRSACACRRCCCPVRDVTRDTGRAGRSVAHPFTGAAAGSALLVPVVLVVVAGSALRAKPVRVGVRQRTWRILPGDHCVRLTPCPGCAQHSHGHVQRGAGPVTARRPVRRRCRARRA